MVQHTEARSLTERIGAEWRRVRTRRAFRVPIAAWLVLMPALLVALSPATGGAYRPVDAVVFVTERVGVPIILIMVGWLCAAPTALRHGILFGSTDAVTEDATFTGAVTLVVMLATFFWLTTLLVALPLHFIAVARAGAAVPGGADILRAIALLPYLLLAGACALLFSTVSREVGIAIAASYLFLYFQGPLLLILATYRGVWQELTAWTPWAAMESITLRSSYDAASFTAMQQRALDAGRPLLQRAHIATMLALTYTGIAFALTHWRMRRRDPL